MGVVCAVRESSPLFFSLFISFSFFFCLFLYFSFFLILAFITSQIKLIFER